MNIDWNSTSAQLQSYKDKILQTVKPSIEMTLAPSLDLTLWQSKVGGSPYLPMGQTYPKSESGDNLQLLAQINFAELPENTQYPSTGILQFFINPFDDLYGLDFDDQQKQDGFRIIFHEKMTQDISQLQQDFPISEIEDLASPVVGQYAITFTTSESVIGMNDFQFSEKIVDVYETLGDDEGEEFAEEYDGFYSSNGHRLGGYPFFTQSDPREYTDVIKPYILLLQVDTDDSDGVEIMWGDSGVGNFFIHPDDLKKGDFSKVLYNWDCY